MRLTTKGKFAVTAILDIAIYSEGNQKPITLHNISKRQKISLSYLEQLFVRLRKRNMVKSYKGPGGGYILAYDFDKLNVSDIIRAVDEDLDARSCHGQNNCNGINKCLTHDLWHDLTNELYQYLSQITVQDLLDNHLNKTANPVTNTNIINFA